MSLRTARHHLSYCLQGQMPWKYMQVPASGTCRVQCVNVWPIEDTISPRSKFLYIFLKGRVRRVRKVSKGQRDSRQTLSNRFNKKAKRQRVAYSRCPLVNSIESRGCDNNSIWGRQHIRTDRLLVIAPHGITRLPLQSGRIDKPHRRWSRNQATIPSVVLRRFD